MRPSGPIRSVIAADAASPNELANFAIGLVCTLIARLELIVTCALEAASWPVGKLVASLPRSLAQKLKPGSPTPTNQSSPAPLCTNPAPATIEICQSAATERSGENKQALSCGQAARLMYPSFARSLQKYLRLSKQANRHNLQSIYEHLAKSLMFGLSARAFLEKFTNQDPVWQQCESNLFAGCRLAERGAPATKCADSFELNSWSLVCDTMLSRQISSGECQSSTEPASRGQLAIDTNPQSTPSRFLLRLETKPGYPAG